MDQKRAAANTSTKNRGTLNDNAPKVQMLAPWQIDKMDNAQNNKNTNQEMFN